MAESRLAKNKESKIIKPIIPILVKPKKEEVVKKPEEPVIKPEAKMKVKEIGGRRWWLVYLGGGLILLGIIGFVIFAGNPSAMVIGVPSIFFILGGGLCVWQGMEKKETGIILLPGGSKKTGQKQKPIAANCLNIYPDKMAFEENPEDELAGHPRKCLNDNKYYFINIWDTAWSNPKPIGKLTQFLLPDTQYRDPRVFALNLRIPAHRKLAQRKASTLEKLSPFILVAAIVIVGIIMIAMSPSPGGA